MELQGFRVQFLSAKDIQVFYRKHHPDFEEEEVDIYEMTLFFVEMHKLSSFFFDEVPFIGEEVKFDELHCKSHSYFSSECCITIFKSMNVMLKVCFVF